MTASGCRAIFVGVGAAHPSDEAARQSKLDRIGIVDSEPEDAFDDIVALASEMCDAPVALVSFVDHERQWFKARVNLDVTETKREDAFCAHAIKLEAPLVVRDTLDDPRFSENPLVVAGPEFRFYCGVPLRVGEGSAVGTLCVLDYRPRELSKRQMDVLVRLARQVERELSARFASRDASPPPSASGGVLAPGDIVADLTVVRPLGKGGGGALYEATTRSGERVALKLLLEVLREHGTAVERFVREARVLARLDHPNVCKLLDVGNLDAERAHLPFMVLELLEGADLGSFASPRSWHDVVGWARQAAAGIGAAHRLGIVHRDVKPSNLFLESAPGARVKVLDFGIAKLLLDTTSDDDRITKEGVFLGTAAYTAPEQLLRPAEVDPRSDVWSMGVTLYELLSGRLPFASETGLGLCTQILLHTAEPVREVDPSVPEAVSAIVEQAMAKDRSSRFASMGELEAALGAAARG